MGDVSLSEFLICTVSVFALTVLCSVILIPILRAHKVGQTINDYGPRWHDQKQGTPMMGGLCFIFPLLLTTAGLFIAEAVRGGNTAELGPLAMTVFLASGCAAVGFIDDYRKLIKKENEGLRSIRRCSCFFLSAQCISSSWERRGTSPPLLRFRLRAAGRLISAGASGRLRFCA